MAGPVVGRPRAARTSAMQITQTAVRLMALNRRESHQSSIVKEPLPLGNAISVYLYRRQVQMSAEKQGSFDDFMFRVARPGVPDRGTSKIRCANICPARIAYSAGWPGRRICSFSNDQEV